jgi:hypothetical protein
VLGGWFGSWACFGLLIAPTAFRVLPSIELAGKLVGPVLGALHWYGTGAGLVLGLLAWALGRGRALVLAPLVLACVTGYSQLAITPEIEALRPLAFGPGGSAEFAARFQHLHRLSVVIFVSVGFATLLLAAAHARADSAGGGGDQP